VTVARKYDTETLGLHSFFIFYFLFFFAVQQKYGKEKIIRNKNDEILLFGPSEGSNPSLVTVFSGK
jgi:hypothetical protein